MKVILAATLVVGVVGAGTGCDSSSMDKDLKRSADRATIKLNRTEAERDALRAEVDGARKTAETEKKRADAAEAAQKSLAAQLKQAQDEVTAARVQIRELNDQKMANQGMPTSRAVRP